MTAPAQVGGQETRIPRFGFCGVPVLIVVWAFALLLVEAATGPVSAQSSKLPALVDPPSQERHVGKVIFLELVTPDMSASKQFYSNCWAGASATSKSGQRLMPRPGSMAGLSPACSKGRCRTASVASSHGSHSSLWPTSMPQRTSRCNMAPGSCSGRAPSPTAAAKPCSRIPQGAVFALLASSSAIRSIPCRPRRMDLELADHHRSGQGVGLLPGVVRLPDFPSPRPRARSISSWPRGTTRGQASIRSPLRCRCASLLAELHPRGRRGEDGRTRSAAGRPHAGRASPRPTGRQARRGGRSEGAVFGLLEWPEGKPRSSPK